MIEGRTFEGRDMVATKATGIGRTSVYTIKFVIFGTFRAGYSITKTALFDFLETSGVIGEALVELFYREFIVHTSIVEERLLVVKV